MALRVIGNKVLIALDEAEKKTKGGIILTEASQKSPDQGTVMAVGTGKVLENGTTIPLTVKDGDKVMIQSGAGIPVQVEGNKYIVVTEDEILAVIG